MLLLVPCFPQDAIALLHHELSDAVQAICEDLDACLTSSCQRQQPHQQQQQSSDVLEQLFVVLSLVTSPSFRASVVREELIVSLAR